MRCPACGQSYGDAYRFCPEDGSPLVPPAPARDRPPASADAILLRAWELFQEDLWLYAAFRGLVALALGGGALAGGPAAAAVAAFVLLPVVLFGDSVYALKRAAGEQPRFADAALVWPHYGSLFVASLLIPLVAALGCVAFVAPGVYLTVSWAAAPLRILDRDRSALEAMAESRRHLHERWVTAFLVLAAVALAYLVMVWVALGMFYRFRYQLYFGPADAALLTLVVMGQLLLLSFTACVLVALYEAVFGVSEAAAPTVEAPTAALPLAHEQKGEPL